MPLSRTHRPQRFTDVTGQAHVTETLRAEVVKDMVGHAYLFSGPRGVGKTTSARIFAKALMCEQPKEGEPCNTCEACTSIAEGRCIDVVEIDAASHSRVEETREAIIEHVRFAPARWKRKIYILDEAHQLSGHSWNALLKTLEEPPPYAVFILATTEQHKVPATIISRCQRFEFKRIPPAEMGARIAYLAKEEDVTLEEGVGEAIVRAADGYVRDAESLLEQLVSFGQKTVTRELAELILPSSNLPIVADLLKTASTRDVAATLTKLQTAIANGIAPISLLDDLLAATRMLIRAQDPAEATRLAQSDDGHKAIHALIGTYTLGELSDMALLFIERRRDATHGVDAVFACELALVTIAGSLLSHSTKGVAQLPAPPPTPPAPPVASALGSSTQQNSSLAEEPPSTAGGRASSDNLSRASVQEPAAPVVAAAPADAAVTLHDLLLKWREVIRLVEEENRALPFILKVSKPESVQGNMVIIKFQYPFHREKIVEDLKSKRILESALRKALNNDTLLVDGVIGDMLGNADRPVTNDIVSNVLNAFGGTVVE